MANVVFDVNLDSELLENIDSLRSLRLEALSKQLMDIDSTLDFLESNGAISASDRIKYKSSVQAELEYKIHTVRDRIEKKIQFIQMNLNCILSY